MSGEAWETAYGNSMPLYQLVAALAEEIGGRGIFGADRSDDPSDDNPNVWMWLEQRGEFDLARCVRDLYDQLVQLEPLFKMCAWRAAGDSDDDGFEREAAAFVAKLKQQRRIVNEQRLNAFADAMRMPRPAIYLWSSEATKGRQ